QNLARPVRAIRLRKIRAVAPVLPGAEEEHLDAIEATLLMHRKDVGLLDAARIDALVRLDGGQRRQTVAVDGGTFEIECARRLFHFAGKLVLHRLAAARQERVGLTHQRRIILELDLARTRRRAALDLVEQTWPRARFEEWIAARAQQERALQRVDGAVDCPDRSERPVILPRPGARAAMLE